jgi:excisionase family DNA binding protein
MSTSTRAEKDELGGEMNGFNSPESLVADGLATIGEAARFLSLGRSKLYGLMDAGALPHCKIGRSRRIPWRAVKKLAEDSLNASQTKT